MHNQLLISELFASIQGESSYAGLPCYFIRLAGCNLNCSYCDTEYAKSNENADSYSINEILDKAKKTGISLVEITGGEPLLQEGVNQLSAKLLDDGFTVLIETNGSLSIASLPDKIIKIIDCKCPSSGESDKMDFANFAIINKADEIKFVVSNRQDYLYATSIIHRYNLTQKVNNIILSPDCTNPNLPAQLAEWIVADKIPIRLQMQLHKQIWDPELRGK